MEAVSITEMRSEPVLLGGVGGSQVGSFPFPVVKVRDKTLWPPCLRGRQHLSSVVDGSAVPGQQLLEAASARDYRQETDLPGLNLNFSDQTKLFSLSWGEGGRE